jgi:signal transduction histidine kinase
LATKWKSRLQYGLWALLLTFGLSGILTFLAHGTEYMHGDYFRTQAFQEELGELARYVNLFEVMDVSEEEVKKEIKVTNSEIEEYRSQYGNLNEQVNSIKEQYVALIQEAQAANNQVVVDTYIKERDAKIDDITKNFTSDEHVNKKIVKDKEKEIEEFYQEREQYRAAYSRYKRTFTYYLKDSTTGKIYTNVRGANNLTAANAINEKDMLYVANYTVDNDFSIPSSLPGFEEVEAAINFVPDRLITGKVGVANNLPASNSLMMEINNYQQRQIVFWVYMFASVIALVGCYRHYKKEPTLVPEEWERARQHYNRIPIDAKVVLFMITSFSAIGFMFVVSDGLQYLFVHQLFQLDEIIVCLILATISLILLVMQGKFLQPVVKSWSNVKKEWKSSLLSRARQRQKRFFQRIRTSMSEAFHNRSLAFQVFFLFAIFHGIAIPLGFTADEEEFIIVYFLLFIVIGLPIFIYVIKKLAYFNRIVQKTSDMAVGNHGEDLPIKGKSVFAKLATNINQLKSGVKHSQTEQAKSERMKTELITNVSHDLRTPLTSIITYTELLKANDLSDEDRSAYLEIIDRKSKRLKVLIDDLFEVSKMASGSIELNKAKVDLSQLLQQALAEHDNTMNESNLQFRVSHTGKPVYSFVDGQKLWRVFDNLIENVLKYSQENTRVYISLQTNDHMAIITFKNISKFELGENSEELFERFKRGDTSRHTEGSGLGLAIAKSIIDLHEGSLDIDADGDLFKVIISLKLED